MISVGPLPGQVPAGEEGHIWSETGLHGTVVFRRRNVTFKFGWSGTLTAASAFAQNMDNLLLGTYTFVHKGEFAQIPQISGLPTEITVTKGGAPLELTTVFSGFGSEPPRTGVKELGGGTTVLRADGVLVVTPPPANDDSPFDYDVTVTGISSDGVVVNWEIAVNRASE